MRQARVADEVSVVELTPALPAPNQVPFEIAYSGICGFELHPLVGAFRPEISFGRAVDLLPALGLRAVPERVIPLDDIPRAIRIAASGYRGKVLLAP